MDEDLQISTFWHPDSVVLAPWEGLGPPSGGAQTPLGPHLGPYLGSHLLVPQLLAVGVHICTHLGIRTHTDPKVVQDHQQHVVVHQLHAVVCSSTGALSPCIQGYSTPTTTAPRRSRSMDLDPIWDPIRVQILAPHQVSDLRVWDPPEGVQNPVESYQMHMHTYAFAPLPNGVSWGVYMYVYHICIHTHTPLGRGSWDPF